jgi:hypothetical protein
MPSFRIEERDENLLSFGIAMVVEVLALISTAEVIGSMITSLLAIIVPILCLFLLALHFGHP